MRIKNKRPHLLVVSSYDASYVLRDIESIKRYFLAKAIIGHDTKKNAIKVINLMIQILKGVFWSDVSFIWFADFRALVTIFFSKLLKKKTILVVGGYEVANVPEFSYGRSFDKINILKSRFTFLNADIVLVGSEYLQKEVKKLFPSLNTVRIALGIHGYKKKIDKKPIILTVGSALDNIYKLKGLDVFAQCSAKFPDYTFVIVGKYDNKIREEMLKINPQLLFTGELTQIDVFKWMKQAKVYCQLSYVESFGVALLEAMSFGCIPVVTPRGAMPEIVANGGFYAEFGNVEDTIHAINKAIASNKFSESRKRVVDAFPSIKREMNLRNFIENLIWN